MISKVERMRKTTTKKWIRRIVVLSSISLFFISYGVAFAGLAYAAHEHTIVTRTENEIPATCVTAGRYDLVEYCSECGEEISRMTQNIKKLGHDKINVPRVAPTCEEVGYRKHYECTRCGKWYHRKDKTEEVTPESQILQALGHLWDEGTVTEEATCTKVGVLTHTCERDGSHTKNDEIKMIPHVPGDVVRDREVDATCEGAGSYDEVVCCEVCNVELTRETKTVEPKGHTMEKIEGEDPGCVVEGSREHWQCSVCKKLFLDSPGTWEVAGEELVLPPCGHVWGEWHPEKEATCTEEGNIEYGKCKACEGHYVDRFGEEELAPEERIIEKKEHKWSEPTYLWNEDNGKVTALAVCSNAILPHFEIEMVSTISKTVVEPTCVSHGKTEYTANFRKDLFATQTKVVSDIPVDHDAHAYTAPVFVWSDDMSEVVAQVSCENDPFHSFTRTGYSIREVTGEATCEQEGEITYTAKFADNSFGEVTKTVAIPKSDHKWDEGTMSHEPTCTEGGERKYTCTICHMTREEHVDPVGHMWSDGMITRMPKAKVEGIKTFTCRTCGKTREERIPALIPGKVLLPKMTAKNKTMTIKWNSVENADGYDIFFAKGRKPLRNVGTVYVGKGKPLRWTAKKLRKRTCYTARVKAFIIQDGRKTYVTIGPIVKAFTSGGNSKYTNPKKIKVKKKKIALKAGGTFKIKAKVNKHRNRSRLKLPPNVAGLRYMSSNTDVATVTRTGKVKAVSKGSCKVFVYAANGVRKVVTITVY